MDKILDLSLCVVFNDIPRFVQSVKMFVTFPVAKILFECLIIKNKQQKLSFENLLNLMKFVISEVNQTTIEIFKHQLIDTPLSSWIELIELKKANSYVMDVDSIESFLS